MTMESENNHGPQRPPKPGSRRWARRAMLSALAGGGLTAGLGGPLAGGAVGAEAPTGGTGPGETPPAPVTGAAADPTEAPQGGGEPTTTTSTTPAPTSTSSEPPAPVTPPATAPAVGTSADAPAVVVKRKQKTTAARPKNRNLSKTGSAPKDTGGVKAGANTPATGPNGVTLAPQTVAAQPSAFGSLIDPAGTALSAQSFDYYRIPLFLLPIYQAAAIQYGVPWQVLAAINEVETNYGSDLAVSTAGAVGWMQFMPQTWNQYGVDANRAGYADPYNPIDAIFAAARYLRAAGAPGDLHRAILAYNHSEAYASSVMLRAKLISSFPQSVIATLTGLTEGRPPIAGLRVARVVSSASSPPNGADGPPPSPTAISAASATAGAVPVTPGLVPAPTPAASAAHATPVDNRRLVNLMGAKNAVVVAVQDGRVVKLGHSRKLGDYVVLRDVYGDVFTYAGLGSVASTYRLPDLPKVRAAKQAKAHTAGHGQVGVPSRDPAPSLPASAGHQPPVTLKVSEHLKSSDSSEAAPGADSGVAPAGLGGKVRLFAHPGNPDALASAARASDQAPRTDAKGGRWLALRPGSIVRQGTVLGHVRVPTGARAGHLLFSIRPAGDRATINPRPILHNWKQLDSALHPQGAKAETALLGATAADAFLLSRSQLEREVLADPGIEIYACGRQDIASGAVDTRVLATLAFLSRSGLKPTVSALRCGHGEYTTSGNVSEHYFGDAVDISAINGIPISGHQGAGSIADTTIRALLTLQGRFVPHQIISLMQYPGAANTLAMPDHWNHIHVGFHPVGAAVAPSPTALAAHSAGSGATTAPSPLVVSGDLSPAQWNQLIARIGALPTPKVASKPSVAAIRDPQAAPSNHDLGADGLPKSSGSAG